ncbi:MAG TPA: ferrochelatase [Haliscomenobacter sp.]|uniref:ferrochelatase n=1 Tax=Haliscomenobacter sp. TaxID=2717303 RepID=UPI002CD93349|nr:ferrochelatase [Haliscomenobacter sp.]HOY20224.1 ferrochelatase [Haliscomenobacter sp.]HPH17936.1 ferrochelatase [Haliscomenobacter sp.]
MVFGKKGILLVNLGTPNSPSRGDVYVYLRQFLTDPRVIDIPWLQRQVLVNGIIAPFRSGSSAKLYQELWTPEGSPIKIYGERVAAGLQALLGDEYVVALGMRYQNPSIESALKQLIDQQVSEITVFPMFPQYASASTGSVHDEVMRLLRKEQVIPNVRFINSYYDHDPMIEIFADNARKFDIDSYDHILFSFHGLPQRQMIKADACNHCLKTADCCETVSIKNQFCYSAQSHGTAYALAKKLNLTRDRYTISFQSRLGRDPWIQPYTIEVLEKLAKQGAKRLLVFSAAFVADCLETIVEISSEYQEEFHKMGGETVDLVPSLNDDPRWIKVIADMVR